MTRILLCGCFGKMGRVVAQLAAGRTDCVIAAGVDLACDPNASFPAYTSIDAVQEAVDVIIDFSHPSLLSSILGYAAQHGGIPAVLCTTGYSAEQVEALKSAAETQPVFYSRNMSLGINLLIELSKKAAKVLGDQFDIEIIEKHHNQKIDAPSGTALMIADAISEVREGETQYMYDRHAQRKKREKSEIGLHAVRGGTIVGEHEVIFAGNHEVITLSHSAQSKELFAVGAVNAAVFMCGKAPGLYDMSAMI
ncbi:MAG: 4-hydroxy-tetrahydrodipicolinate reductase [Hominenteromicrobium sp.]